MSNIITKLKEISMNERRNKSSLAPFTVFVINEVEKVGKNDGNRVTTEAEAISVVRKLIATANTNLSIFKEPGAIQTTKSEIALLELVMPKMASETTVLNFLAATYGDGKPDNKGAAMKALRDEFGALVDMKQAGKLVTDIYGV